MFRSLEKSLLSPALGPGPRDKNPSLCFGPQSPLSMRVQGSLEIKLKGNRAIARENCDFKKNRLFSFGLVLYHGEERAQVGESDDLVSNTASKIYHLCNIGQGFGPLDLCLLISIMKECGIHASVVSSSPSSVIPGSRSPSRLLVAWKSLYFLTIARALRP